VIQSNIGQRQRRRDDLSFFPKIDWHVSDKDQVTFAYNYNTFNSPGGEITFNPVSSESIEALSNNSVRDHHATAHWTHVLSPTVVNAVHASYLRDEQLESPTGLVDPNFPSVNLFSPQFFLLGNPGFSLGDTREYQWELNDRVNWVAGRNTMDFGVDFIRQLSRHVLICQPDRFRARALSELHAKRRQPHFPFQCSLCRVLC